ncbi:HutD family protein [Rhizobium viscosum]|uniref:Environmental stress-induced protein Ves n=1 Tax=Rhizobium viscosum TaxID=1673 RepID=A0ABR9IY69_RHIVS|nr:HutD family protein [Rhizobium viscosum]MBE1508013.1 environmental stress-induced protein Ves [Rhizobium viscosum]
MKVLRAADHKRMPWKNGGGETVEIAISPEGAGLADFDWRVSTATVASDGPFSIFPGIDRTLSILDGKGMRLLIEGREPVLLTQASEPLTFAGDIAVSATLPDGTITDLNVMSRRGAVRHAVARHFIDGEKSLEFAKGIFLLFCVNGALTARTGAQSVELDAGDAMLLEESDGGKLDLSGQALCYAISIERA